MAKRIKGITIELDGETKGLDRALKDVNKRTRDVNTELRDVERLLKFNPDNVELLEQKQKLLGDQVENTRDKLNQLKDAQEEVKDQFKSGEIDEGQYRAFQREIVETESKLGNLEGKLESIEDSTKKAAENLKKTGDSLKDAGGKMTGAGKSMTGYITGPLLGGLALATEGTEELRGDLATLETNAENAGVGTNFASDALERLSGISTETDSNVEALSNLLATGFDEEGLLETMDALSGAVVQFPDTLKIEGLADGLQETLATGEAIGPFAEMLERLGVNVDDFNAGLATASENGAEQDYILQTLANTGLTQVNDKFRENNEELVESREAQTRFRESMAELGNTLQPIITAVTNAVQRMINWFNELSPTGQRVVLTIAGIAAAIGPLLMIVGQMTMGIGSLIKGGGSLISNWGKIKGVGTALAGGLKATVAAIFSPTGLIILGIAAAIAAGIAIYKNWDKIKAAGARLKESLVNAWTSLKSTTVTKFNQIKEGIMNPINRAKEAVRTAIEKMKGFFNFDWKLPKIKMPKFSVSGSMNPINWLKDGVPKLSVSWNADGGIFNRPTILDSRSGLQGVGEAGSEAILPLNDKTLGGIGKGIAEAMGGQRSQPIYLQVDGKAFAQLTGDYYSNQTGVKIRQAQRGLA